MTVFSSLLSLELFVLFISVVVNTALIFALKSSSLFHPNLKIICIAHLGEFYFLAVAQVVLICYQSGILKVTDERTQELVLIGPTLCQFHFVSSSVLVQSSLVLERTIATVFIQSYERKSSSLIGISLCCLKWAMLSIVSVFLSLECMTFTHVSTLLVALLLLNNTLCYTLLRYNKKQAMTCSVGLHSLMAKYHLTENIRILKLVGNIFILITATVGIAVILMVVAHSLPLMNQFRQESIDVFQHLICGSPVELFCAIRLESSWQNRLNRRRRQRVRLQSLPTADFSTML